MYIVEILLQNIYCRGDSTVFFILKSHRTILYTVLSTEVFTVEEIASTDN
jgi:hypothetical protein